MHLFIFIAVWLNGMARNKNYRNKTNIRSVSTSINTSINLKMKSKEESMDSATIRRQKEGMMHCWTMMVIGWADWGAPPLRKKRVRLSRSTGIRLPAWIGTCGICWCCAAGIGNHWKNVYVICYPNFNIQGEFMRSKFNIFQPSPINNFCIFIFRILLVRLTPRSA